MRADDIFLFLILVLALLAAWHRPLAEPDEGRYGEAAREMMADGGGWLPLQSGQPYPDKPPGVYWLMHVGMELAGTEAFGIRLPAWGAFCALLILLRRWRSLRDLGPTAALIAATSPLLLVLGQLATLDMVLTVLVALGILSGYAWLTEGRKPMALLCGLSLGYAFVVKGPVAWLLGFSVLLGGLLGSGRVPSARHWLHPLLCLPMLGIGFGWYAYAGSQQEHLWDFWLFRETLGRVSSNVHSRAQPFWYFPVLALAATHVWLICLRFRPHKESTATSPHPMRRLFLVWAWLPVLMFSIPTGKQPAYLAPAIPGFALWLAEAWQGPQWDRWRKSIGTVVVILLIAAQFWIRDPEAARSDDPIADALYEAEAQTWPGGQLMGWSYGLTFRLQRTDLVACGPTPAAWKFGHEYLGLAEIRGVEKRYRIAFEIVNQGEPAFIMLHQLEDSPQHFTDFPAYCEERGVKMYLWVQMSDKALFANRPKPTRP